MTINKLIFILTVLLALQACNNPSSKTNYPEFDTWEAYDESALIDSSQQNNDPLLRYQLIQSRVFN